MADIQYVATVADLHIGHIGKRVSVGGNAGSVSGKLVRIDAGASVVEEMNYGDLSTVGSGDVMLGQVDVVLTIGRAVVPVRLDMRAGLI